MIRIYRPNRDEMIGGWRKLHKFYSWKNTARIIKFRRLRRAGYGILTSISKV
jgi:hypothetical protein